MRSSREAPFWSGIRFLLCWQRRGGALRPASQSIRKQIRRALPGTKVRMRIACGRLGKWIPASNQGRGCMTSKQLTTEPLVRCRDVLKRIPHFADRPLRYASYCDSSVDAGGEDL